jgi:hypothetical protein
LPSVNARNIIGGFAGGGAAGFPVGVAVGFTEGPAVGLAIPAGGGFICACPAGGADCLVGRPGGGRRAACCGGCSSAGCPIGPLAGSAAGLAACSAGAGTAAGRLPDGDGGGGGGGGNVPAACAKCRCCVNRLWAAMTFNLQPAWPATSAWCRATIPYERCTIRLITIIALQFLCTMSVTH